MSRLTKQANKNWICVNKCYILLLILKGLSINIWTCLHTCCVSNKNVCYFCRVSANKLRILCVKKLLTFLDYIMFYAYFMSDLCLGKYFKAVVRKKDFNYMKERKNQGYTEYLTDPVQPGLFYKNLRNSVSQSVRKAFPPNLQDMKNHKP